MPSFDYCGFDRSGHSCSGSISASSVEQALLKLRASGVTPVSLQVANGAGGGAIDLKMESPGSARGRSFEWFFRTKVSLDDIANWTKELATMLRAGLPLDRCLRLLQDVAISHPLRTVSGQILADIKSGQTFSRALARHPGLFDEFFAQLVRAGELTGNLAGALDRIHRHQQHVRELRERVVAAATYPLILAIVSVLTLLIMLIYVVPQFSGVFGELGDRLPWGTQIVLALSKSLTRRPVIGWGLLLVSLAGVVALGAHPGVRKRVLLAMYRWPLIGVLLVRYRQAVFARTMAALLGNGVSMIVALNAALDVFPRREHRQVIAHLAGEVKAGARLGETLQKQKLFEPLVVQLVKVGEETGRLAEMWEEAALIVERDVQQRLQRLLTLLEPVLILLLGAIVAGIILAIVMGILAVNDLAVL